jgi:hypothetical protein
MSLASLGLALWLAQSAASPGSNPTPPARPKAPPGLSWEDSDQIADTVSRLERRLKAGKPASREPITVTERQVNSYVALELGPKLPPSITGLRLRFEPQRLAATGTLDLDAVRSKLPSLLAFMGGTVPVVLKGRLSAARGQGKIDLEEATVGGISLPASLLSQMVAQATRSAKQPEGVDILAPFPLPWTAESVRLESGRAVVEFAQPKAP